MVDFLIMDIIYHNKKLEAEIKKNDNNNLFKYRKFFLVPGYDSLQYTNIFWNCRFCDFNLD